MSTTKATAIVRRRGKRVKWLTTHFSQKIAGMRGAEWRNLLVAQFALLWAQALVWVRPLGQLVDAGPDRATAPTPADQPGAAQAVAEVPPLSPEQLARAQGLALGVRRAAAYGVFRPLCLVRSVALNRLLDRNGIRGSRIRVGVRWAAGEFSAHAWVEHGSQVLGDDVDHVNRFASLSDVRLLKWS